MKNLALIISFICLISCGSHKSTSEGFTQNSGGFEGVKDESALGQLKAAMDQQDYATFETLIRQDTNVDFRLPNSKNATPLIYAAFKNLPKFALLLLNKKADPTLVDDDGKSSVDHAKANSPRIFLLLDQEQQLLKGTELVTMIDAKRDTKVFELLGAGVNPNFIDEASGETPLTKAILSIGKKVGANPTAQEKALKRAITIARFLIEWQDKELGVTTIDINLPNREGFTPLGFAISKDNQDNKEIIDLLIRLNAKETL